MTILQNKRGDFDEFWSTVDGIYPPTNRRRNDPIEDIKVSYRKLFYEIMDAICGHIEIRFKSLKNLAFLELLDIKKQEENTKKFPDQALKSLHDNYGEYFDITRLKSELSVLYKDSDLKGKPVNELLYYLRNAKLDAALQQLTKLCELALTIPATSASVERFFSNLKRIHSYTRNAQ